MRHGRSSKVLAVGMIGLMAAQAGCAGHRAAPPTALPAAPAVSETERAACEAYSGKQPTRSYTGPVLVGVALLPASFMLGMAGSLIIRNPGGFLLAPEAARVGVERVKLDNWMVRKAALDSCLEPAIRAHRLGPDHPEVADALVALAERHAREKDDAGAVALYRRALDIRERAFGPDDLRVATTMEATASLLRRRRLDEKAGGLEARAQAIRTTSATESDARVPDPPEPVSAPKE